jgi:hypothetical protein
MHTGTLPAASNRATYRETFEVFDDDTDTLFDLTDCTIVFEVRARGDGSPVLSASTDDGNVTIQGTGVFDVLFSRDETSQFIAAHLPVIDGVVTP